MSNKHKSEPNVWVEGNPTKSDWALDSFKNKTKPTNEQPKDYALYYSMKNFDFSGFQHSDVKCDKCSLSHSVELIYDMAKTQGCCECTHCGNDIGYQIVNSTSKRKQETTPIVEVHYEYCHGIYVVLALLIGGLIGFIFGVGR